MSPAKPVEGEGANAYSTNNTRCLPRHEIHAYDYKVGLL